jgi:hypothetical protein
MRYQVFFSNHRQDKTLWISLMRNRAANNNKNNSEVSELAEPAIEEAPLAPPPAGEFHRLEQAFAHHLPRAPLKKNKD